MGVTVQQVILPTFFRVLCPPQNTALHSCSFFGPPVRNVSSSLYLTHTYPRFHNDVHSPLPRPSIYIVFTGHRAPPTGLPPNGPHERLHQGIRGPHRNGRPPFVQSPPQPEPNTTHRYHRRRKHPPTGHENTLPFPVAAHSTGRRSPQGTRHE